MITHTAWYQAVQAASSSSGREWLQLTEVFPHDDQPFMQQENRSREETKRNVQQTILTIKWNNYNKIITNFLYPVRGEGCLKKHQQTNPKMNLLLQF